MSLFQKTVFGWDTNEDIATMESYSVAVEVALEDSNDIEANMANYVEILQEDGVIETIKNFFKKAWEKIKAFFGWIKDKISDFIGWIKGLFTKKKKEQSSGDTSDKDKKEEVKQPAPGIPVNTSDKEVAKKIEEAQKEVDNGLKRVDELLDSIKTESSPEEKAKKQKQVNEIKKSIAEKKEEIKKLKSSSKTTYKPDNTHNFGSSTQNVRSNTSTNNRVSGVAGRQITVTNYLDLDKINVKSAMESIKKNVFATLNMLGRISKGETDNDKDNFATFLKKNKEAVDGFIANLEKSTVESKEFNITMDNVQDLLARMEEYRRVADDALEILKTYDHFANNLIIKATNPDAAKYANKVFKESIITPFNNLANRISKSALAIGRECVKFLNPDAKISEEE